MHKGAKKLKAKLNHHKSIEAETENILSNLRVILNYKTKKAKRKQHIKKHHHIKKPVTPTVDLHIPKLVHKLVEELKEKYENSSSSDVEPAKNVNNTLEPALSDVAGVDVKHSADENKHKSTPESSPLESGATGKNKETIEVSDKDKSNDVNEESSKSHDSKDDATLNQKKKSESEKTPIKDSKQVDDVKENSNVANNEEKDTDATSSQSPENKASASDKGLILDAWKELLKTEEKHRQEIKEIIQRHESKKTVLDVISLLQKAKLPTKSKTTEELLQEHLDILEKTILKDEPSAKTAPAINEEPQQKSEDGSGEKMNYYDTDVESEDEESGLESGDDYEEEKAKYTKPKPEPSTKQKAYRTKSESNTNTEKNKENVDDTSKSLSDPAKSTGHCFKSCQQNCIPSCPFDCCRRDSIPAPEASADTTEKANARDAALQAQIQGLVSQLSDALKNSGQRQDTPPEPPPPPRCRFYRRSYQPCWDCHIFYLDVFKD